MKCLFMLVNGQCNLRCKYCFYTTGYQPRNSTSIKAENTAKIADKIAQAGFGTAAITGGEPLHQNCKEDTLSLLHQLKARGLEAILNTSGTRLTDMDLDRLVATGVDRIDISIDSHLAAVHDQQRGLFRDTVATLTGLISRGYRDIVTTTVVTMTNAPALADTIDWLHSLGVSRTYVQPVFLPASSKNDRMRICQFIAAACQDCGPRHRAYLQVIEAAACGQAIPAATSCEMGKECFVCEASGRVIPCFHRTDVVLGNLLADPIKMVMANLETHELRQTTRPSCFGWHCVSLFDPPAF